VTDPADLAHDVLLKVGLFIRGLPADQLKDLAEGTAKLELVPKGGRPVRQPRTAAKSSVSVEQVRTDLAAIGDRAAAVQYLTDLRLTVPESKDLAKELGIAVKSSAKKDEVIQALVQWTVGRRVDADVLSRHTGVHA